MNRIAFIAPACPEEECQLFRSFGCRSFPSVAEALKWEPDAFFFAAPDHRQMSAVCGIPVLYRRPPQSSGKNSLFRYLALRSCYRKIDIALAGCGFDRAHFLIHGIPQSRTFFLPRTVDNAVFADSEERCYEEQARRWRLELDIPEDRKVLLCLGGDSRDVDILLESYRRFQESDAGKEWYLLLPGKAPGGGGVRYIVPEERPAPPVYYRLGDLSVATARRACSCHPEVNSVMASSRPVLLTETVGGAAELIEPGKNGWCVDSAHPELWFDYLKPVGRERLRRMGEHARETMERPDRTAYAERLSKLLIGGLH